MLAPLVPHVAEELWSRLGNTGSVTEASFPQADPALLVDDMIEIPIQVNGKVRGTATVPADADESFVVAAALDIPNVVAHVDGREIRKTIVVLGRMVNIVV
jgi:leucyl-tRNA synthetase